MDGTGKKAFTGSLLIHGDRIEEIIKGDIEIDGHTIDCTNRVIAPGIIDMHSHMDWMLPAANRPDLTVPFTRQGVTTVVGGNCGFGVAGFKKNTNLQNVKSENPDFYETIHRPYESLLRTFRYLPAGIFWHAPQPVDD